MTRSLLILTALLEAATGLALLAMPSMFIALLLSARLEAPAAATVAHVAGAALMALGLVCWLARDDGHTRAGRAVISGLLVYNLAVVAVLVHAGLVLQLDGVGLWPAVLGHGALAIWCIASLRSGAAER